ncbi:histamine H2 receptor-like [Chrysoperla carnea]|uniref:histamine H2 receptor-like n=1 Tax=Chrysoperla carnea TaxID=189513 RepID=UPI001D077755|nr:histamine H2 receptor-like [Chrysoperla carnea]
MSSPALGVPLTLFSTVGVILNGYILLVVILTKQSATANNLLLMHLGIVDTLLGVLFLIFAAPTIATRSTWLASGMPCTLHGFLFTLLHPVALWTVCGLNCDRYYAIAAPLHYGALVNSRKVAIGLGFAWFISILLCIPPLFTVAPYRYSSHLGACAPDFTIGDGVFWYSTLYTALTLLLPAALILGCNIKVLMIARYHRHRIASAIYEVTLSAQVTITHQRNPFFVPTVTAPSHGGPKFRGRSAVSTVLQLLGSFLLLYFPYYSIIVWNSTVTSILKQIPKVHPHIVAIASFLITCSPPINGLLYGVKSKTLRKTFQNYWRKQMSKSEMNQEIQARTPSTCGSRRPSLTPLGVLTKPCLQRRLSEALIDVNRQTSPQASKIKRIASELSWRPLTGISLFSNENTNHDSTIIPHTSSCNTLQVPHTDADETSLPSNEEEIYFSFKPYKNKNPRIHGKHITTACVSQNTFLHRVLGTNESISATKRGDTTIIQAIVKTPARKPKILITRAFSEESEKNPSTHGSPSRTAVALMNRKHSISTTTLLERKWRTLKGRSTDEDSDSSDVVVHRPKRFPLTSTDRSSDSSTASDASSSGRMYMSLDDRISFGHQDGTDSDGIVAEESLLLSWPTTKKLRNSPPRTLLVKQKTILDNSPTTEIVLQEIVQQ